MYYCTYRCKGWCFILTTHDQKTPALGSIPSWCTNAHIKIPMELDISFIMWLITYTRKAIRKGFLYILISLHLIWDKQFRTAIEALRGLQHPCWRALVPQRQVRRGPGLARSAAAHGVRRGWWCAWGSRSPWPESSGSRTGFRIRLGGGPSCPWNTSRRGTRCESPSRGLVRADLQR
jgi:hypothetical protein